MKTCKIKRYDEDENDSFPHKVFELKVEEARFLQNFLNTLAVSDQPLNFVDGYWGSGSCLWISEGEYQALIGNAELLGIEFTVSN
jgi:hypothetical protein